MSEWYNSHINAAYYGDVDTEQLTLELWEQLRAGGGNGARVDELARAFGVGSLGRKTPFSFVRGS